MWLAETDWRAAVASAVCGSLTAITRARSRRGAKLPTLSAMSSATIGITRANTCHRIGLQVGQDYVVLALEASRGNMTLPAHWLPLMLDEQFQIGLERGDDPHFLDQYRELLREAVEETMLH
jgi:hypothetical protein